MLEQLYNDFTTKVAPMIAEGFTMTKDYFFDLFGRYVKYLIVIDTIFLVCGVLCLIVTVTLTVKYHNRIWNYSMREQAPVIFLAYFIVFPIIIASLLSIFYRAESLAKTIFVPEVRVLEVINDYKHNSKE